MNSEIINIYNVCKHIAENKQDSEVNVLLAEELSELIKSIMKLERFYMYDESLRCNYNDMSIYTQKQYTTSKFIRWNK